jgi:hypothetical protein
MVIPYFYKIKLPLPEKIPEDTGSAAAGFAAFAGGGSHTYQYGMGAEYTRNTGYQKTFQIASYQSTG